MKKKLVVLVMAIFIALTVVPVMAARPMQVHIEVEASIDTDPDPFVASGAAVDAGLLCASGDVFDLDFRSSGPPSGSFRHLIVWKHFVCEDGSGTFDVKLVARLDRTTGETSGNWVVVGGEGDYVGFHGNGNLIGIPHVPGHSILDIYDGKIH